MNRQTNDVNGRGRIRKNTCTSEPFHQDAVTAKTISRLSQGVARLTANDCGKVTIKDKHNGTKCENLAVGKTGIQTKVNRRSSNRNSQNSNGGSSENGSTWMDKIPSCPKKSSSSSMALRPKKFMASQPGSAFAKIKLRTPMLVSPLPPSRCQPRPIPGSKRTFTSMMNESLPYSFRTSKIKSTKDHFRRNNLIPPLPQPSQQQQQPPGQPVSTDLPAQITVYSSRTVHRYLSSDSSDPSMLSITPPRSSPSASSSPVISSDSDSDTRSRRTPARRNRRRGALYSSHELDCWQWRTTSCETHRVGTSLHYRSHRLPISSNGDDSSDGPLCQKKARVSFPSDSSQSYSETASRACLDRQRSNHRKKADDNDQKDEDKRDRAREEMKVSGVGGDDRSRHRSNKSNYFVSDSASNSNSGGGGPIPRRRTASLSPGQTRAGRRQKLTRFKLHLEAGTTNMQTDCYQPQSINEYQLSDFNTYGHPHRTRTCHSDADAEGDDECSDAESTGTS